MSVTFDELDKQLIDLLQSDSSISNKDLAEKVGLSPSACLSRTKRLKEIGAIKKFAAIVDEKMLGYEVTAFTFITLSPHNRDISNAFLSKIKDTPQILECYNISGSWDYLIKIISHDLADCRDFLIDTLLSFPGVNKIETSMVLSTDKQSFCLPFETSGP
ncbi:Lrp/AsnC family transcriptional regulator [Ruminiclostridium sufflavum DSM 19573]|uniref:Lrp/AsnC family transcriptional regulator n=1 Tax=Ruminiclostridium sufflavum DSM 19573 TaxID=1121337 RepID=A0A318XP57_9FIRM|nr:Lrp/AsnC family transcriptional regulator [Ruminiclostridium sufflavum]PYG87408.1 Lrp/AsnC family transcriptional regulator [Ruminiclostridium sufflavum DSM 19573]